MEEMTQEMQEMPAMPDEKTARKAFSRIGLIYLVGIILIYAISSLVSFIIALINEDLASDMNVVLIAGSVLPMYLVGFPLMYLFMKKIPAVKLEKHKLGIGRWFLYAFICLGLAYTSNIVGNILTTMIGDAKGDAVDNVILDVATSVSPWVVLGYMVILAPIGEELMFRKLIVDRAVKYGKGIAILLSGLMFGLFHGNLNQFIYAFVIGCFFAFLYVKTGNIKVSISMHMLFNFIGGFVATNLLEEMDIDALLAAGDDTAAIIKLVSDNPGPWIFYGLFIMFVLVTVIVGVVLFIVFAVQGKFKVTEAPDALPKGRRAAVAFGNVGMILYIIFWTGMIVMQLLGLDGMLIKLLTEMAG